MKLFVAVCCYLLLFFGVVVHVVDGVAAITSAVVFANRCRCLIGLTSNYHRRCNQRHHPRMGGDTKSLPSSNNIALGAVKVFAERSANLKRVALMKDCQPSLQQRCTQQRKQLLQCASPALRAPPSHVARRAPAVAGVGVLAIVQVHSLVVHMLASGALAPGVARTLLIAPAKHGTAQLAHRVLVQGSRGETWGSSP